MRESNLVADYTDTPDTDCCDGGCISINASSYAFEEESDDEPESDDDDTESDCLVSFVHSFPRQDSYKI